MCLQHIVIFNVSALIYNHDSESYNLPLQVRITYLLLTVTIQELLSLFEMLSSTIL